MAVRSPIVINRSGLVYPDRIVIVTGGSKGIGEGCARVFVDAGANVIICARGREAGEALAEELNDNREGTCRFIQCDVSQPEEIQRLIEKTVDQHGKIDCLINNAGYHPPVKRIDDFTIDEFQDVIKTNLISYWVASKYCLPHLRKTGGSIINMSSLVGYMGQEGATTYCATKGGITAFTKALAIEEAGSGVRVNAVLPGNIISNSRTEYVEMVNNPEEVDSFLDSTQHNNRSGTNEEVGQLCLFLASDGASFLSGTAINISYGAELGYGIKYPLVFLDHYT